jgi:ArsR family transcriptional regulator
MAAVFKALGEVNRLRVFALLARQGTTCVGDLVSVLDLPQSTVSRHLATLRRAGLVVAHRSGTWVHYAISDAKTGEALRVSVVRCMKESEVFADDAARAAALAAAGGCCPSHPPREGEG